MSESSEGPVKGWQEIDVDKIIADKKATEERGYFEANRPTVVGFEKYPERTETREHFESSTFKVAVMRMVNDGEMKHCQDCWGVRKEPLDVRRMAVADGVGSVLVSATASEIFCSASVDGLNIDLNKLPKINEQDLIVEIKESGKSKMLKHGLLEKVQKGAIAATTLSAVEVQGDRLRYHQLGDSKMMVIRPDEKGKSSMVFETQEGKVRDRLNKPYQYGWDADRGRWEKYGKSEIGETEVQEGDIVVIFTDGLYTGNREQSQDELHDEIREVAGRISLYTSGKSMLAQILREDIAELAKADRARDDVTLGVMVV